MTTQEILNALEAERMRQGITYYEVAERMGEANMSGVKKTLTGKRRDPGLPFLLRVAEVLGKTLAVVDGEPWEWEEIDEST